MADDSVARDQLRAFIERIERMEEEKTAISFDIKEIYAEAKGNGFNTKVLRQVIRIRKQDHAERMEQEAILELYLQALGMVSAPNEASADSADEGEATITLHRVPGHGTSYSGAVGFETNGTV